MGLADAYKNIRLISKRMGRGRGKSQGTGLRSMKTLTLLLRNKVNNGNIHVKRKYADVLLKTDIGKIEIEVNACNEITLGKSWLKST